MAQPIWVGIDVSGKWLDVGSHPQHETTRFPNTDAAITALLTWLAGHTVTGVAMEATGGIERSVAYALADAGFQPRIVNPKRVRDFSKSISPVKHALGLDPRERPHRRLPHHAFRRDRSGGADRARQHARAAGRDGDNAAIPDGPARRRPQSCPAITRAGVRTHMASQIKAMRTRMVAVERDIEAAIKADELIVEDRDRLCTMPSIGLVAGAAVVAWLPELGRLSAGKIAALWGWRRSMTTAAIEVVNAISAAGGSGCATCSTWPRCPPSGITR
jgi:transposase